MTFAFPSWHARIKLFFLKSLLLLAHHINTLKFTPSQKFGSGMQEE
jgi:hypothetical protein